MRGLGIIVCVFLSSGVVWSQALKAKLPCETCHTEISWQTAAFDHAKTGFVLEAKHSEIGCKPCHSKGYHEPLLSSTCGSCHKDVHGGQLGQACQTCHEPRQWRLTASGQAFGLEQHRRSSFPLTGRHAMIPCQECHLERREQSFSRASINCVDCHLKDYQSTSGGAVDHGKLGFSTNCRQCHQPSYFKPAKISNE